MPNLEQTAVTAWLTELRPDAAISEWPPAIRPVETQAALPERLVALGAALDDLAKADPRALSDALCRSPLREEVRSVLAQLGAARALRLLHWLAEADLPDCHAVIAALVEQDGPEARSIRAAVAAVTQKATVRRIFAPERIAALANACNALKEDA
jgi:hypothetical protein